MSKFTLYGTTISPYARKIKIILTEKRIEHEHIAITPIVKTPELLAMNPLGKIPVLKDDYGRIINDSSAMAEYLEERFPELPLLPQDPYERARARWFEEYADSKLYPVGGYPGFIFQRVNKPLLLRQPTDSEAAEASLKEVPPILQYLESQIKGKDFFAGAMFTIADISVASVFCNYLHAQFTLDASRYPDLAMWLASIHSRPSFCEIINAEKNMLEALKNFAPKAGEPLSI